MRPRTVLAVSALTLASCDVVQDLGRDLQDHSAGGAAGDTLLVSSGNFDCVGQVSFQPTALTSLGSVVRVRRWGTDEPVDQALVTPCSPDKLLCEPTGATAETNGSGNGAIGIDVESALGFWGYLELERSGWSIRNLRYFVPPVRKPKDALAVAAFSPDQAQATYVAGGFEPHEGLAAGSIAVQVLDCDRNPADGITLTIDGQAPPTRAIYFQGPDPAGKARATDSLGYAVLAYVPEGMRTLRAFHGDTNVAAVRLAVRNGVVTSLELPPTPIGSWWEP